MLLRDKYLKHAFEHPIARRYEVQRRVEHMPVCGRCERLAFRDGRTPDGKVIAVCPVCGWRGIVTRVFKHHVLEVTGRGPAPEQVLRTVPPRLPGGGRPAG